MTATRGAPDVAPQTTSEDLVPRPARLLAGLAVGVMLAALFWVAVDPGGPLAQARLADRLGLPKGWAVGRYLPYGIAAAGGFALLVGAVGDFRAVGGWARPGQPWRAAAYDWCKARLPYRHGPEHRKAEVRQVRQDLAECLARRWGRYFVLAFVLILVAFLTGYAGLRAPPKGAPPPGPPYEMFWPLVIASAAGVAALLLAWIGSVVADRTLGNWQAEYDEKVGAEFVARERELRAAGDLPSDDQEDREDQAGHDADADTPAAETPGPGRVIDPRVADVDTV